MLEEVYGPEGLRRVSVRPLLEGLRDPLRAVVGEVSSDDQHSGVWLSRSIELDGEQEEVIAVAGDEDALFFCRVTKLLAIRVSTAR
jgi:hypothetical protein